MYHYKNGQFLSAFGEESTPKLYRLWSLLYTADKQLILTKLLSFIKTQSDAADHSVWVRRANLYVLVMFLTSGDYTNFFNAAKKVSLSAKHDSHDVYFLSLAQYLVKLANYGKPDFVSADRNSHLIGDSHALSLSMSWNFDKGSVSFLPAVTIRELSSSLKLPAHYAFENAVKLTSADQLVFSVGEIDQRGIYSRIESYQQQPAATKERLQRQLSAAMKSLRAMVSPYQEAHLLAMPPFFESLVPPELKHRTSDIQEWIAWYGKSFSAEAERQGFGVLGTDLMKGAQQEHLIDHAHFKPDFYEGLFS